MSAQYWHSNAGRDDRNLFVTQDFVSLGDHFVFFTIESVLSNIRVMTKYIECALMSEDLWLKLFAA